MQDRKIDFIMRISIGAINKNATADIGIILLRATAKHLF